MTRDEQMIRDEKWDDVWQAVKVVAVVGAVVTGFILVGVYISRKRAEGGLGSPLPFPRGGVGATGLLGYGVGVGTAALAGALVANRRAAQLPPGDFNGITVGEVSGVAQGAYAPPRSMNVGFRNFIVADRAIRIVSMVVSDAGRMIRVTVDQPIRIMDSASVDSINNQGTFVTPGTPLELGPIGADQQFFAVRAGPTAANVSVMTQFVRGE